MKFFTPNRKDFSGCNRPGPRGTHQEQALPAGVIHDVCSGALEIEDGQLKNVPDVPQMVAKALAARLERGLLVVDAVKRKSVEQKVLNVVPVYDAPQRPGED